MQLSAETSPQLRPDAVDPSKILENKPGPGYQPLVYILSSKTGLGHASRAVAIAQELSADTPLVFATYPQVQDFIAEHLEPLSREYRFIPLDYKDGIQYEEFVSSNEPLFEEIDRGHVVVNDFLPQVTHVRRYLDEHKERKLLVGVYHSIDGYDVTDSKINSYQQKYQQAARALDFLFLVGPRQFYTPPYKLENGTLVVPTSLVVRTTTKNPMLVKQELGLQPDDNFILIQGGMMGNSEFSSAVKSLGELQLDGLKRVIIPHAMRYDPRIKTDKDVIVIQSRIDGHNVVAASSGVITKPGMQIASEAIAYSKPILMVGDIDPERQLKMKMIESLLDDGLPYQLDVSQEIAPQIDRWLSCAEQVIACFSKIPCRGAREIGNIIVASQRLEKIAGTL